MTVELFECAYLELQPSGDYVRHVASFTLNAPFGDFVVLMMSPSSMEVERQAEQDFNVVLDLTASETSEADVYSAGYTVASPQFMAGFAEGRQRGLEVGTDLAQIGVDPGGVDGHGDLCQGVAPGIAFGPVVDWNGDLHDSLVVEPAQPPAQPAGQTDEQ